MKKVCIFFVLFLSSFFLSNHGFAQTEDAEAKKARLANEERIAKEAYGLVSRKKKKKSLNLDGSSVNLSLSYIAGLGGTDAPYKRGLGFNIGTSHPIFKNHVLLDWQFNNDLLFSPNNAWYSRAFSVSVNDEDGVGSTYGGGIQIGVSPILVNSRKFALTLGPMAGIYGVLDQTMITKDGVNTANGIFSLCYGLKSNIYIGDNFTCYVQYAHFPTNRIDVILTDGIRKKDYIKANFNSIRVGVGFRINYW